MHVSQMYVQVKLAYPQSFPCGKNGTGYILRQETPEPILLKCTVLRKCMSHETTHETCRFIQHRN